MKRHVMFGLAAGVFALLLGGTSVTAQSQARETASACTLLKNYRITNITGDRYAGEWPRERFRQHGIKYVAAEKPKSDLYRDVLALLNSGRVELLDHQRLMAQLVGLERRTARGGDPARVVHNQAGNRVTTEQRGEPGPPPGDSIVPWESWRMKAHASLRREGPQQTLPNLAALDWPLVTPSTTGAYASDMFGLDEIQVPGLRLTTVGTTARSLLMVFRSAAPTGRPPQVGIAADVAPQLGRQR